MAAAVSIAGKTILRSSWSRCSTASHLGEGDWVPEAVSLDDFTALNSLWKSSFWQDQVPAKPLSPERFRPVLVIMLTDSNRLAAAVKAAYIFPMKTYKGMLPCRGLLYNGSWNFARLPGGFANPPFIMKALRIPHYRLVCFVLFIVQTLTAAIVTTPSSIDESLDAGQTLEISVDLGNTGPDPVEWTVETLQNGAGANRFSARATGTDAFGYRWSDSTEAEGPVFEWVDLSSVGTALLLGDDDFSEVSLPFPFVFYGEERSSVKVSSNGFLSFGPDGTDHTNDPVPSSADPNALIAAYWTDLDPTLGGSIVTYHDPVGGRFIVQYTDIQPFGGGEPVSFQIALHETGDITFYYKTNTGIGVLAGDITVGIEDSSGGTGSSVAYSDSYIFNGLAVHFASPTWLSVSPRSGLLEAGSSTQVTVRLNAGALVEDNYSGTVSVSEGGSPSVDIPVTLAVTGTPAISVDPLELAFAPVGVGGSDTRFITLSNPGTAPLSVSALDFSNTDFAIAQAVPFDIAAGAAQQLVVSHTPTAAGAVSANLTILSNDSGNPSVNVSLSGEGMPPSDIDVNTAFLSLTLPAGDTGTLNFGISNSGVAPLNWEAVLNGDLPSPEPASAESVIEPDFTRNFSTDRIIVRMKEEKNLPVNLRSAFRARRDALAQESGTTKRRAFARLRNLEVWELRREARGKAARAIERYRDNPRKRVKALVRWLKQQPDVLYAEPDYLIQLDPDDPTPSGEVLSSEGPGNYPVDPSFGLLWGMNNEGQEGGTPDADIDAPEAWLLQTGAPDIVVGVIDTGVDYDHEDLAANMWVNPGEIPNNGLDDDGNGYVDDIHGWDWVNNDRDPDDDHDHGSHCAGTIAGVGDNGIGVTGVAWNTQIMALKFLDSNGSGYLSDAIYAIDYATANGARVTSNSWGGGGYSQAMADSIEAAGEAGVLFVAAAGNSSRDNDASPTYPSSYEFPCVLSVAATTRFDEPAYFTNYGATSVDLGAPGAEIFSTKQAGTYGYFSGTSMATPHVSGAAAMILGKNPLLTPVQVKEILMSSVDPIPALDGLTVTGGRLNLRRALDQASPPWFDLDPISGTVAPGNTETATVTVDASFLGEGLIEGTITLFSDDPDESVLELPLEVTVTPAPALRAEPTSLDFGEILLGGSASIDLVLANSGSQTLTVFSAILPLPFSHEGSFPMVIEPGERVILSVTASGQSIGTIQAMATLISDDPTDSIIQVPIGFTCLEPPVVSPISGRLDFSLVHGETDVEIITLNNSGVSDLEYAFSGEIPSWLSIGAGTGAVPAGLNVPVEFQIDAAGLERGQYATQLILETNDPITPSQLLLLVLQVDDGPFLVVEPVEVHFDGVYIGYPQDQTVILRNDGNEVLEVISTSVSGSGFSLLSPWSGNLAPGESIDLIVRANPSASGPLAGTLSITSNDAVKPNLALTLTGSARELPGLMVSPLSFSFALNEGDPESDTLLIENNGLETLEVSLEIIPEDGGLTFGEILSTIDLDEATGDETIFSAEYANDRFYVGGSNIGPNIPQVYVLDKEGNYISQFDLPGVPPGYYGAYDLAWDGTALYAGWSQGIVKFDTAGNFISSLPLPEEFGVIAGIACDPDTGNLWINGYSGDVLEIDAAGNILRRFPPPPSEGLFGMAWDDASPDGPFLWIYEIKELSTRKIHQFDPVAGEFTGFTFTVNPAIGWSAGLAFTTEWAEGQATLIALSQADEDRWVHVVNVADVQGWLAFDTYAASVPPGGSAALNVLIDSAGVLGGPHSAQINLSSNDPGTPLLSIPVSLDVVGTPGIELQGAPVVFAEPVFLGDQAGEGLRIRNSGTDVLTVSSLSVAGAGYSLVEDSAFSLDPQESRELQIVFAPLSTGTDNGTLTIISDDPGQPSLVVGLSAEGIPAPVLDVDTTPITISLIAGDVSSFDLSIGNTGGSMLTWQASPHDVASLSSTAVAGSSGPAFILPGDEPERAGKLGGDIGVSVELLESTPKPVPYSDGFEDGRFTDDWYMPYTTSKTEVSNASAGEGIYSFHAYGATEAGHRKGIYQVFENSLPDYFSFRIRTDDLGQANAYVVLGEETWQLQSVVYFFSNQTGFWFMGDNFDSVQTPAEANRWYLIECRDIDWASRTFDYYIDGTLVQRDLGFRSQDAQAVNQLHIYNFRKETSGWWDDIRLSVDTAEWMRLETGSSETNPDGSVATTVTVSANYLDAGSYNGYIIVRTNDPASPEVSVPVTLNVTPAPGIYLPETGIDMGAIVDGGSSSSSFILSNSGTDPLTVTSLVFSDPVFSSSQVFPLTLQPGENSSIPLEFAPDSVGPFSGNLTIFSNSPVAHSPITLTGQGLQPPTISVDQTPITLSVAAGQDLPGNLAIHNTGQGDLELKAFLFTEAVSGGAPAPASAGAQVAGGPDNYGYTFRDERDSDGPMFQWEEIAIPEGGAGTELSQLTGFYASSDATQNDDAYVWPMPLPFDFPFYGTDYTQIAVGAYGVTYFEDDGFGWYMRELPTDNVQEGRGTNTFIATYNDNLDILPGAIYVHSSPERTIIEHYRATSLFQEWATFQTILYPNGDIRMQWLETGPWLKGGSATIGIQGDSSSALPYGRWGNLVEAQRSIYYTYPGNPYRDWLRSGTRTASVSSGQTHTLEYTVKGEFLLPGTYNGRIEIRSNDAAQSVVTIPVVLTVTDPSAGGLSLIRNFTFLVPEGGSDLVSESNLLAASPVADAATIVYTVTSTGDGQCLLDGSPTGSFTQADIAAGRVSYEHDGSDSQATTTLGFNIDDGVATIGPFGLAINVSAVNDPPVLSGPATLGAVDGLYRNLTGMDLEDPDISHIYANWDLSLAVDHGKVRFEYVPGGVNFIGGDAVQNNDSSFVSVQTWLSRLQANLRTPGGIQYMPDPGFTGTDTLTVQVNDNGNTGTGPGYIRTLTIPIEVYSSEIDLWRNLHFSVSDLGDPLLEPLLWGDEADPDFDSYANIFEYLMLGDPLAPDAPLMESGFDGVHLWLSFPVRSEHPGVNWHAEWGSALNGPWWSTGIVTDIIEEHSEHDLMRIRIPAVDPGARFLRLKVENANP